MFRLVCTHHQLISSSCLTATRFEIERAHILQYCESVADESQAPDIYQLGSILERDGQRDQLYLSR